MNKEKKTKQFYLKGIIQNSGENVSDWIKKVYNIFKNEGNNFILYITENRFSELLEDLNYYGSYHQDILGYLNLIKMKIEKTDKEEYIVCYKKRLK